MIVLAAVVLAGSLGAATPAWHDSLQWQGQQATMTAQAKGGYVLRGPFGTRDIPAPKSRVTKSANRSRIRNYKETKERSRQGNAGHNI